MAEKVEMWKSLNGRAYDSEVEALRADVVWLQEALCAAREDFYGLRPSTKNDDPVSSYGSSGGGGHD